MACRLNRDREVVIPAYAGIQNFLERRGISNWIPAYPGMTGKVLIPKYPTLSGRPLTSTSYPKFSQVRPRRDVIFGIWKLKRVFFEIFRKN